MGVWNYPQEIWRSKDFLNSMIASSNKWELNLSDRPMELKIFAGAYQGDFELGGLSLTSLRIADGAADVNVNFSELNQVE